MAEMTNRAAYLKGLADGMRLDTEKNEGKLLSEIIDFLCDLSAEVEAIDDSLVGLRIHELQCGLRSDG